MRASATRVIVAFDAAASPSSMGTAIRLARLLEAELAGVFVEELEALHLAELPFAAIVEHTGRTERLTSARLDALLRAAATRAESGLKRAASRAQIPSSFRVARGRFLGTLRSAASEHDVIVVGTVRVTAPPEERLGPVAVALGVLPADQRLLELAAAVASQTGQPLLALTPSADVKRAVEQWATERRQAARVRLVPELEVSRVAALLDRRGTQLLLASAQSQWLGESALRLLRRDLECPLVLVS